MFYTINETRDALKKGETSSVELVKNAVETFNKDKSAAIPLNAFIEMYDDAVAKAEAADKEISEAKAAGTLDALYEKKPLLGIPFANKDNISCKGNRLTCASKILEGYVAPYSATVINRLEAAGAIPLGRCNQDEFAMGSSTEYSCYGPTRNPINREYVSGGSSGGSAAAVSANQALFGLGTETGGSVRLPASYCGIYGLKPTYGVLSRWGVVAYGSSLDQVGILGHTPADIAQPLACMSGVDMYDDTSADLPEADSLKNLKALSDAEFKTLKIAIPKQFMKTEGADPEVIKVFNETRAWFESKGAKIEEVDLPILDASIAAYYVIALSEAASNLSRFDGIRYGRRVDNSKGYDELYVDTRSEGFGPEVKRRIIIGNYVLSEQFSGDTYKKGMTVRARIQREMAKLFESYDLVIAPTCPTSAFKLGQKVDDPLEMYLSDMYTVFVNLARIPSISVPAGKTSKDGMPVGVQFAGAMFSEAKILRVAQNWEDDHKGCGIQVK
ncbi:aspartyl/glutamyl-tRNA(Asn/Gln) amidotransferase, A subunit [Treponema sp. JC4]|uniref:Asp-tRNA(Asn)/Glu-tRNA(Gln) amidotransferase subunit GatA n=1 Tax=Treponema sp. JC4 TaxID=1124982 RepID=UPI00025AFD86|nr:Asp-tRNA(Asn)/Glu-tRNA(Gln) amidotransferase subunit GatA [Treponema sp. JC4]EID84588.1 aspartyl/glutamyl-tRNA(Asn/Gln) amidotransferase, A subunit [Treponema sp. JC4]